MHRAVSALALQFLADGKICAYESACAHQTPHWVNTQLTPERALELSLSGFVQPEIDIELHRGEREAALKQIELLSKPAWWDLSE